MISKLMLLEQVTIQIKKQQLLNKGISSEVIDKLLQCDPTNKDKSDTDKVGSYTDWITSRYLKDRQFNDFNKLHSQLEQYDKSKHKIPDKELQNIGQFKSLIEFITFVNNNQDKLNVVPADFIVEEKNDYDMFYSKNYIIHVPHTEEQAKVLGSGTKWCTSQEKENYFQSYYNEGYLFYITDKTTKQKRYNLYLHEYGVKIEFANDKNKHLTYKLFDIVKEDNTLIPQIKSYYEYKNINPTYKLQLFFNCKTVSDVVKFWKDNINNFADIYFEKDENKLLNSIKIAENLQFIPNPSPKIQLQQLTKDMNNIHYIESPDYIVLKTLVARNGWQINYMIDAGIKLEHDVQLLQVSQNGDQIRQILKAGIKPKYDVQLQQVSKYGHQIKYIIDAGIRPEYDIQLQQVKDNGEQIQHIMQAGVQPENDKEWHDIQLQQVTTNDRQIEYIIKAGIKPDTDIQKQQVKNHRWSINYIINAGIKLEHDVQLQQVSRGGNYILYIIETGIKPEHDVQLQQVSKNGEQIQYIIDAGIKPEYDVQLQQVSQDGYQIKHIIDAGVQPEDENEWHDIQLQQVSQNGKQIQYIINAGIRPEHDVQLQQVSQYGYQIEYIIKAGIRPEYDIQLQQVKDNGEQIQHIIHVGIIPEHDVQLQQVSQYGYQIEYIIKAGIRPEHDVQLQQVSQNSEQLYYITKAGIRPEHDIQLQQVSKNGFQIRHIKNPSEKIQLQQIKQDVTQYEHIKNPTPKQTQLYKQLSGITESTGYISKLLDVK